MKNTTYSISIEQPCTASWQDMKETACGKYCKSCEKTVFDFTGKSDRDIIQAIEKSKGNLCGRFYQEQLQRPLVDVELRKSTWLNRVWAAVFMVGTLESVQAEKIPSILSEQTIGSQSLETNRNLMIYGDPLKLYPNLNVLNGKILHFETGEPLANMTLQIRNTNIETTTDSVGNFTLNYHDSLVKNNTLSIYIGTYKKDGFRRLIDLTNLSEQKIIHIDPNPQKIILGGSCVYRAKKKKWWQFWK